MDQLDRDAREARKLGMSYGQYIAKYKPPVPIPERRPNKKTLEPVTGQQKRVYCVCCGKEIPEESKSRKYCGPECAHTYRKIQENARHKRLREAAKREKQG